MWKQLGQSLWGQRRFRAGRARVTCGDRLECRTLLATLVSSTKVTYRDADGDDVSVTFSQKILTPQNVNAIFQFNTGSVDGNNGIAQQLRSINLLEAVGAAGTTITTVSIRNAVKGGDGYAALGEIQASGIDLGTVVIDGDLARIEAGNGDLATAGLAGLTVHSLGRFGTVSGAPDLHSKITGRLTLLKVKTDVKRAFLDVQGGVTATIDSVTIGGSIIGGTEENSGRIHSSGNMSKITIGGDIHGGAGTHSGMLSTDGNFSAMTIGGSIIGGSSDFAGSIQASFHNGDAGPGTGGNIGLVKIVGDLIGGSGTGAGSIITESGNLAGVTIGGSMIGGAGSRAAQIYSPVSLGPIAITGNVIGGSGEMSAQIKSLGQMGNVTIGGSLRGGDGNNSGQLSSIKDMGVISITGNLQGGAGDRSGSILMEAPQGMPNLHGIASVSIGGSVKGGAGDFSGLVSSQRDLGILKIAGDLAGGDGPGSGGLFVQRSGRVTTATINGSVIGGVGFSSGDVHFDGAVGSLSIKGDLRAGSGDTSGSIISIHGAFTNLAIGGSLIGGTALNSGRIAALILSNVTIAGNVVGSIAADEIGNLTINGSIIAGSNDTLSPILASGSISAYYSIGNLTVKGSLIGNATNSVEIRASSQRFPIGAVNLAIGSIKVFGRVEYSVIDAGAFPVNADAQIGPVTVGGDWIASSLIAGVSAGPDHKFGTIDDSKNVDGRDEVDTLSRIASITIGGEVVGTDATNDHFGFVAESIGSLKIGDTVIPLLAGRSNDSILLNPSIDGLLGDVRLREI